MLADDRSSDTGLFSHLSCPTFRSLYIRKKITSEDHLLFQSIPNLMNISEMQKKIQKIFFDFEIIAFELVPLDTRFY